MRGQASKFTVVPLLLGLGWAQALGGEESLWRKEYSSAWRRLVDVYGNANWTIRVRRRSGEEETLRLLARWPAVRIDEVGDGATTVFASVWSPRHRFRVRRVGELGVFLLTSWSPKAAVPSEFWYIPSNRGWLPLATLSWFGGAFVDLIKLPGGLELLDEKWVSAGDERQLVVELRVPTYRREQARLRLWFTPDKAWIVRRWGLYMESDDRPIGVCELEYRDGPVGVPLVERGRFGVPGGPTLWEAHVLEVQLSPPPEEAFRPEAFGIPTPSRVGPTRFWLWAVLGTLGLLTVLVLFRFLGGAGAGPDIDESGPAAGTAGADMG